MATPAPARSGFRIAGPEVSTTIYSHPPLVESWLGVDFAAETPLTDADSEALRAALGPEWSGSWKETSPGTVWQGKQLTNVMGDRALRLIPQGFSFGWLGHGGEYYPRYESVRDGFVTVLDAVRALANRQDKALHPLRWSVRYVNRIPRGTVWSATGEWSFFSMWQPVPLEAIGVNPTSFRAQWELPLEAERGNLSIEFRHDPADSLDDTDFVWINLTASGPIDDVETSLFDGLDFGREVIVRSFNELVSADAKAFWGVRTK